MRKIFRAAAASFCAAGIALSTMTGANAQEPPPPVISPLDANVNNGWTNMYLSGYPSGWRAVARSTVPGGNCAHFQFTGPNGLNWSSPTRCNPATASVSGTGAGQVCVTQWVRQANGSYLANGRPCARVY